MNRIIKQFVCEFCGVYTAPKAKCNKCEEESLPHENKIEQIKEIDESVKFMIDYEKELKGINKWEEEQIREQQIKDERAARDIENKDNTLDLTNNKFGITSFEREAFIELRYLLPKESKQNIIKITKEQAKQLFYSLGEDLGICDF